MADEEQREEETPETSPEESGADEEASVASAPEDSAREGEAENEGTAKGEASSDVPTPAAPSPTGVEQKVAEVAAYTPSYVFLVVVTVVNLVADLWSKAWAKNHFESLRPGDPRRFVVLEDHLNLIFAKNRGGAWGLLQNETESLRRPFFLIVSVAAIVFIVTLYRKLQPGQTALKWGLPLVLGGALGNLVDRIRYGFVVDFIDVYMQMDGRPKHWPTFNVADISICVGVGLMAIDMFTSRDSEAPKKASEPAAKKEEPPPSEEVVAKQADEPAEPAADKAAGEGA